MKLVKAYIETLAGARVRIPVLFNPAEYHFDRANVYKSTPVPGLGAPLVQFVNGDAATLSMDLFLDDFTDQYGVTQLVGDGAGDKKTTEQRIADLESLLDIDANLHAPRPVLFAWGPLQFQAVLEKLSRKVTMFHADGFAARATVAVTFRQYRPLEVDQKDPPRQSADKTKRRRISAAENIWLIADKDYGDVREWRRIASESDVDDPRALVPGDWLRLPPIGPGDGIARAR